MGGERTLQRRESGPTTNLRQPSHHSGPVGGGQVHADGLGVFFTGRIAAALRLQRLAPGEVQGPHCGARLAAAQASGRGKGTGILRPSELKLSALSLAFCRHTTAGADLALAPLGPAEGVATQTALQLFDHRIPLAEWPGGRHGVRAGRPP